MNDLDTLYVLSLVVIALALIVLAVSIVLATKVVRSLNQATSLLGAIQRIGGSPVVRLLILDPRSHMDIQAFSLADDEQVVFPLAYADKFGNTEPAPPGEVPTVASDGDGSIATGSVAADGSTLTVAAAGAGKLGVVNFTLTAAGLPPHPLAVTIVPGAVAGIQIGSGTTSPLGG